MDIHITRYDVLEVYHIPGLCGLSFRVCTSRSNVKDRGFDYLGCIRKTTVHDIRIDIPKPECPSCITGICSKLRINDIKTNVTFSPD